MITVDIREAKAHLLRFVDEAARGKPFIVAKAGKPMVKVTPLDAPSGKQVRRLGFLEGQISVPKDFNTMGCKKLERLFGSNV